MRSIRFEGPKEPFSDAELSAFLKRKEGRQYAATNARAWADKVTDQLVRRDYRDASVRFREAGFDRDSNTVDLIYDVDVGAKLAVSVEGSDERGVLRQIPFRKKTPYSDDALQETLDGIEEWYQKKGYFFARARSDDETSGGVRTLTIMVQPGDQYELGDVVYSGIEQMPEKRVDSVVGAGHPNILQRLVATATARKLGVTISQLDEDRQAIEALYRTNGFLTALVDRGRAETRDDAEVIDIIFEVFEGPQTILSSVEIVGLYAMDRASLPTLMSVPGATANPIAITTDVIALQAALSDAGFSEARVSHELQLDENATAGKVVYLVEEGDRFRYGTTTIRGNTFTADHVIEIKARRLKEGRPYSFNEVAKVQRELYQLGLFRRVTINPVPSEGDRLIRNLLIEVEEGEAVRVTGSVGYSTDEKARLRGSISHRNLFGKARYIGADALYSDVIGRYFLTYREPFTFGTDISTQVTLFKDDEIRDEIHLDRYGVYVESSRVVGDNMRYSIRYDYRVVTPTCPTLTEEECQRLFFGIQTEKQDDTIASISQTLFWDRRDDAIAPSKGFLARASLEYAFPAFESTSEFLKGLVQTSWFRPAGRNAVLGISGRIGLIHPMSVGDPFNPVPFSERFLAGGEYSHRGFRLKKMGILGVFDDESQTVDPDGATIRPEMVDGETIYTVQGGNAMLIINAEYRYALTESIGVTGFLDIGQIWRLIETVDLGDLKFAPGVGIYYNTPVGPIRFDLAYNIDAQPHEDEWLPFLTVGYSF